MSKSSAAEARAWRVRGRLPRAVRAALAIAGLITLFIPLDTRLLVPLYNRGTAQPLLGYVNGLAIVLQTPGLQVRDHLPRSSHYLTWVAVAYATNFAFYFLAALVALVAFRRAFARRPTPPAGDEDAAAPADPSRRRFLAAGVSSLYASGALVGSYSLLVEPRAFGVGRYTIPIDDLPASLDGLTLAQVTDVHHCRWLPVSHIDRVVRATNALNPDVILLTGDYTLHSPEYVAPAINALAKLRARIATVAVLGNHDWHGRTRPLTQAALRAAGFPLLDNTRRLLTSDRRLVPCPPLRRPGRTEGLVLAGVGDFWYDRQDYDAALGDLLPSLPRLLLSHNPDVAEDRRFLSCGHRCDLMISGHTHGGQIRLPLVGSPWIPSRYGDRYARGLNPSPTTRVFTSPGIGMTELPLRFACPPEISLLTLRRRPATA